MKKVITACLLFLVVFSGKSQENFNSISLMILEKAPATTHSHMTAQLDSTTVNYKVIKKENASGGDTFFTYYKDNLSMIIDYSKDTLLVSALMPSAGISDIETELLEKEFKKTKIKSLKNAQGDVLKRYKWSKKDYPYRFITYDNYKGILLLTKISDEY